MLIKCMSCKKKVSITAMSCPYCGDTQIEQQAMNARMRLTRKRKRWKYLILACVALFVVALILGNTGNNDDTGDNGETTTIDIEEQGSLLATVLSLTPEQESAMIEAFDSVGIGEIVYIDTVSIAHMTLDGEIAFRVHDAETQAFDAVSLLTAIIDVWICENTKEVIEIGYRAYDLMVDGEALRRISNYHVTALQRNELYIESRMLINELLYPYGVEFIPLHYWTFDLLRGEFIAIAFVTVDESQPVFQITWDNERNVISVLIDDVEFHP